MRRTMVAGNWKMHGTGASVAELIKGLSNLALPSEVEVAVFPPALYIDRVVAGLQGQSIAVGGQNSAQQAEQGHSPAKSRRRNWRKPVASWCW